MQKGLLSQRPGTSTSERRLSLSQSRDAGAPKLQPAKRCHTPFLQGLNSPPDPAAAFRLSELHQLSILFSDLAACSERTALGCTVTPQTVHNSSGVGSHQKWLLTLGRRTRKGRNTALTPSAKMMGKMMQQAVCRRSTAIHTPLHGREGACELLTTTMCSRTSAT